ncbi:tetratricopeptide repeat protein [Xylocopilactobacillus apicola]|uniref:Tetratricopeptide repeat protein n=1 Tax=Xylocopilactobacillus apicola TaxID=2932184 RepID=A0AAU9CXC4_9LACO|nr:tetratricopeptide repeat protein [Xylocopilactobacillus apicola]BDR58657.1 hypothetical protein XA3_10980 [Xylocopilactobacillus apicola]
MRKKIIKQKFSKEALASLGQGDIPAFIGAVNKAIIHDDPETLAVLGETLYDSGNLEQAADIFRSLIKKDPQNSAAKIMLADIINENGDADGALNLLAEIPEDDEKYLAVLMQKADIYQTIGLEEVSESLIDQALQKSPENRALIFGMAEILYSQSRYLEAKEYYQKLLDMGISSYLNQNIRLREANCLTFTGDFEAAAKIFERFNDVILRDDDLFAKGSVYFELHLPKKAIKPLETLLEKSADYAPAYLVLAKSYEELDEFDKAYEIAQKGWTIDAFDLRIRLEFAKIAIKLGYLDQAINSYQEVLKQDPENILALDELGLIYLKHNENEAVIDLLAGKEGVDPNLAWILGQAYLNKDQLELAKENLISVFNEFQDQADYLLDLINLFRKLRDVKSQLTMMQLYLKIRPTDDTIANEFEALRDEYE